MPTTVKPRSQKKLTDSEPIKPEEPVTTIEPSVVREPMPAETVVIKPELKVVEAPTLLKK